MKSQLAKLKALNSRIVKFKKESYKRVPTKRFLEEQIMNQLNRLLIEIKNCNPELFGGFKLQNYNSELEGEIYNANVFDIISNDIQYFIDVIEEYQQPEISNISITDKGIFFAGQYFDAFVKIAGIVENAKNEICLIDGYVDEKIINVLKQKNTSVKLKILTNDSTLNKIMPFVNGFKKQYGDIEIKSSKAFHF